LFAGLKARVLDHRDVTSEQVHARRWWTLGVLCICLVVTGVDNTILNVALPSIVKDLGATGSQLQWMVDAYTIVFACLLLTAGSLGDRYGRRGALMFGLSWFAIFSALASTAGSPSQLIVARGLMGIGGAFIFPTTLSILTNTFTDPSERARAIGVWAGVAGIGIAIGPLAGGLLVEHFGWGAVFFVNVPVCATAVVLARFFVPKSSSREESPLDPLGALLSICGLVPILYAVIEAPNRGWGSPVVAGGFSVGFVVLAAFWFWERHNAHPMLDVRFFKNPRFSAASATITLTYFALFGSTFLLTQYFQFILQYSPFKAGLMITPVAIGLMVGSPTAPRLVYRFGTKRVVMAGLAILATAMGCYGSNTLMSSFGVGLVIRFFGGVGMGVTTAPVTESIMGSLPPSRAGVGSAVNDTTRQTGGALGVAVLGSVFAARYHARIGSLSFVPSAVRRVAHESIGSSLRVAVQLPQADAVHLKAVAHQAYLSSMRVTYTLGVSVVLVAILVAYLFLPAHALPPPAVDEVDEPVVPLAYRPKPEPA
jgi:EmrB/QacA subfamily drug resistance transporter